MKHFFSLFAAILFAGSIMAGELVFTAADFAGQGTSSTGSAMSVTKQGITVSTDKGYGNGGVDIRIYAGATLTVKADVNILKVTPDFADGTKMTFDPAQPNDTVWSINATKQIRLAKLTVEVDKEVTPEADPVNLGPKTIAEFIELANTKDTCVITGLVSGIENKSFANFYLSDGDAKVKIYGLKDADGNNANFADFGIANGDSLTVKATYTLYQGEPEAAYPHFVALKKAPVIINDTIDINFTTGVILNDYVALDGWWQIIGTSEKCHIYICSNEQATQIAGTYAFSDLDPEYSALYFLGESDTTEVTFLDGSLVVTEDATTGDFSFDGAFIGSDYNLYNVHLYFKQPTADTTVNVLVPEATLDDSYLDYGLFVVGGYNTDLTAYIQLSMWIPDESDSIAGHYTEDDLDYSILGTVIFDGAEQEIYTASIDITANADGSYTVNADVLCYNNTLYKVTMTVPASTEGIDNTNANAKATKSLRNGILVIEKNGIRYDVTGRHIR